LGVQPVAEGLIHASRNSRNEWEFVMPTVLRRGPYRFFFYAGDREEPVHVHVEKDDCVAKFWLDPVRLQKNVGFRRPELNRIAKIIESHKPDILEAWNEYFGD